MRSREREARMAETRRDRMEVPPRRDARRNSDAANSKCVVTKSGLVKNLRIHNLRLTRERSDDRSGSSRVEARVRYSLLL